MNGKSETEIPDRDIGQAIQTNLPHCLECMVFCPCAQPTLSAQTVNSCHNHTNTTCCAFFTDSF